MKIKLKNLTVEKYDKWKDNNCGKKFSCYDCPFRGVNCFRVDNCWIHRKDIFSEKFLNQEVEIDEPILDAKEKEYLEAVLKPFKNRIRFIEKREFLETMEYIICGIGYDDFLCFPYFVKGTMYKNMEDDKPYTLQELGLFQDDK